MLEEYFKEMERFLKKGRIKLYCTLISSFLLMVLDLSESDDLGDAHSVAVFSISGTILVLTYLFANNLFNKFVAVKLSELRGY